MVVANAVLDRVRRGTKDTMCNLSGNRIKYAQVVELEYTSDLSSDALAGLRVRPPP